MSSKKKRQSPKRSSRRSQRRSPRRSQRRSQRQKSRGSPKPRQSSLNQLGNVGNLNDNNTVRNILLGFGGVIILVVSIFVPIYVTKKNKEQEQDIIIIKNEEKTVKDKVANSRQEQQQEQEEQEGGSNRKTDLYIVSIVICFIIAIGLLIYMNKKNLFKVNNPFIFYYEPLSVTIIITFLTLLISLIMNSVFIGKKDVSNSARASSILFLIFKIIGPIILAIFFNSSEDSAGKDSNDNIGEFTVGKSHMNPMYANPGEAESGSGATSRNPDPEPGESTTYGVVKPLGGDATRRLYHVKETESGATSRNPDPEPGEAESGSGYLDIAPDPTRSQFREERMRVQQQSGVLSDLQESSAKASVAAFDTAASPTDPGYLEIVDLDWEQTTRM